MVILSCAISYAFYSLSYLQSLSKTFLDTIDQSVALSRVSIKFLHIQVGNFVLYITVDPLDRVIKYVLCARNSGSGCGTKGEKAS